MNKVKTLSKNLKNFFLNPRFLVSFFILLTFTIINATYVHAENDDNVLDFYDSNNIFYYDGKASGGCNSPLDLSNNTLYNGDPVLDQATLKKVEENKPVYEAAANEQGFEWQILAAIHGMESSFVNNMNPVGNSQGVYQFLELDGMFPSGQKISPAEFEKQTKMAAEQIRKNYSQGLDLSVENDIKQMFYTYNSGANGSKLYNENAKKWLHYTEEQIKIGEGSPYVMNLADEQRDSRHNEHWQEFHCDHNCVGRATVRPGAFLIYKALGGRGSAGGNNCIGGETGNLIVDTALKLAWPQNELHKAKAYLVPDAYKLAMEQNGLINRVNPKGASCDVFVSSVFTFSGVDPDFANHCCLVSYSGPMYQYVTQTPSLYQRLPYDDNYLRDINNYNDPNIQNGDILLKTSGNGNGEGSGHIAIFYRDSEKVPHMIHASYPLRSPGRTGAVTGVYPAPFEIWRYIGNKPINSTTENTLKTDINKNKATNNTENIPISQ